MSSRLVYAVIVVLGLFLILSLGFNVCGFSLADLYYRQLNLLRLDPLNLGAYPRDFVTRDPAHRLAVFFGDSRAEQWPAPDGLPQYTFINRGIGSQTAVQVALRFDAHIRPLRPDVLIVQVCVNDLKTLPLFPRYAAAIIEGCKTNLDSIVAQAQAIGALAILTTVFPVGEPPLQRRPVWSDDVAGAIETVNDYIRSLVASDVMVFDAYALLADEHGRLRTDLSQDELHLSAAGYALLNEELRSLLATLGETHGTD